MIGNMSCGCHTCWFLKIELRVVQYLICAVIKCTSLGFRKALVQPEDDFIHKVLNVAVLRASHKHHPVVGEALRRHLLPQLGSVTQLKLYLNRALKTEKHIN